MESRDFSELGGDLVVEVPKDWHRIGGFVHDFDKPDHHPFPLMPDWLERVLRKMKISEPQLKTVLTKKIRTDVGKVHLHFQPKEQDRCKTSTGIKLVEIVRVGFVEEFGEQRILRQPVLNLR